MRAVLGVGLQPYLGDDAAGLGVLEAVADEVDDDLAQAQAIERDLARQIGRQAHLHHQSLLGDHVREQRLAAAEEIAQIGRHRVQLQLAGLDLAHVEDVVDEPEQHLAALGDGLHVELLAVALHRVLEQLREAEDRVHRRADLVTHVGEEGALLAVGGVGGIGAGTFGIQYSLRLGLCAQQKQAGQAHQCGDENQRQQDAIAPRRELGHVVHARVGTHADVVAQGLHVGAQIIHQGLADVGAHELDGGFATLCALNLGAALHFNQLVVEALLDAREQNLVLVGVDLARNARHHDFDLRLRCDLRFEIAFFAGEEIPALSGFKIGRELSHLVDIRQQSIVVGDARALIGDLRVQHKDDRADAHHQHDDDQREELHVAPETRAGVLV